MSKKYDFKRGELVTVDGEQGRINFIGKEYFSKQGVELIFFLIVFHLLEPS